jgi:hypothetical protein
MTVIYSVLALLLGLYISLHDLFSTTPLYFAFARNSPALWGYGLIYGVLSVFFFLFLNNELINISISASGAAKPLSEEFKSLAFAIFAGVSIKSLLNISFYNARVDGKTFPVGFATVVKIFEPQLLKSLESDHFINYDSFLKMAVEKTSHLSIQDIHNVMRNTVDSMLTTSEVSGFLMGLAATKNPRESLSLYLKVFGRKIFCHTFPACKPKKEFTFFKSRLKLGTESVTTPRP